MTTRPRYSAGISGLARAGSTREDDKLHDVLEGGSNRHGTRMNVVTFRVGGRPKCSLLSFICPSMRDSSDQSRATELHDRAFVEARPSLLPRMMTSIPL